VLFVCVYLETYLPITSNSRYFCANFKAVEISVFVCIWDTLNWFFRIYYCETHPFTVIEPSQWWGCLMLGHIQKYKASFRQFLRDNACSTWSTSLYHMTVQSITNFMALSRLTLSPLPISQICLFLIVSSIAVTV
jgi:hypothetical protein